MSSMATPVILAEELATFHATHFSAASTTQFAEQFLGPVEEEYLEGLEDDGLGCYGDGVKRTLTDEQIAIFRHSEIQAMLRDRRHAAEAAQDREDNRAQEDPPEERRKVGSLPNVAVEKQDQGGELLEDGELEEEATIPNDELPSSLPTMKNQKSKKKIKTEKAKQKSFFKQYIKPDLRKRTWDKVDTGLQSLDYDEGDSGVAVTRPAQRKRISYDDD